MIWKFLVNMHVTPKPSKRIVCLGAATHQVKVIR